MKFAKFLKNIFFTEHLRRLLCGISYWLNMVFKFGEHNSCWKGYKTVVKFIYLIVMTSPAAAQLAQSSIYTCCPSFGGHMSYSRGNVKPWHLWHYISYKNLISGWSEQIREFTMGENFANTELFLVRIFVYSVRIQENTDQK